MSRREASETTNVSAVYISELETGKKTNVSEACLAKLATEYKLTLEQFVKLKDYYTKFEGVRKENLGLPL